MNQIICPNYKTAFDLVKFTNCENSIDEKLKWWFVKLVVILDELIVKVSGGAVLTEIINEYHFINKIYNSKAMVLFFRNRRNHRNQKSLLVYF